MMERIRVVFSDKGSVAAFVSVRAAWSALSDGGGRIVDEACKARSCANSSRIEARRGCWLASGDGGVLIWTTDLKARRNWRAERF